MSFQRRRVISKRLFNKYALQPYFIGTFHSRLSSGSMLKLCLENGLKIAICLDFLNSLLDNLIGEFIRLDFGQILVLTWHLNN
jgi:hypothetical protein